MPTAQFTPPCEGLSPEDFGPLFEKIRPADNRFFQRLEAADALEKVLLGQLPTRSEIANLEGVFGTDLGKAALKHRPFSEKAFEATVDALNIPRTLMTSWDASAPLRQGVVLAQGHPIAFSKNVVTMFKALAREGSGQAVDAAIKTDKNFVRFTGRHPGRRRRRPAYLHHGSDHHGGRHRDLE